MAKLSLTNRVVSFLKTYPLVYAPLRTGYRVLRDTPLETMRRVLPSTQTSGLPRGFYSGVEQVRTGQVPGRVILEGQIPPTFDEKSLVKLSKLDQDKNQPWPVFWLRQDNAYLSGPTLCVRDTQGRLMAESTFWLPGTPTDPAYRHFATKPKLRLEGNVTSMISMWLMGDKAYWHFMLDGLTRLAMLNEFPPDTRILVPPLSPSEMQCLADLGLKDRCIVTEEKAIEVEHFYFSAPSAMTGCYNAFGVQYLRNLFLPRVSPSPDQPKRFYIGREGFTRSLSNEREVREFFRARGWEVILPEKLSIFDQVRLFSTAEAVVAVHGSALTNLLWYPPTCRVLEIMPSNFKNGVFEMLARTVGVTHDYLICPASGSRFHADLGDVARKLEALGI